jgi:hypothetical protein
MKSRRWSPRPIVVALEKVRVANCDLSDVAFDSYRHKVNDTEPNREVW